jgi:large subunit ribosomal protein L21
MYAIIKAQGKQFKVEKGQVLRLPRMTGEPGSKVTFGEVLLTADGDSIHAGTPTVKGASVTGEVVGEVKGEKIYVFRFKRRKNVRRKTGHRSKLTEVKITGIKSGESRSAKSKESKDS